MTQPPDAIRLRMQGIHKRFGATIALAGIDLEVRAGEVHALVGENGAGKSTLMKILAGALRADGGSMWVDGAPYAPRGPADGRRAGVAMIYQELSLAPHLSVMENVLLGVEPTLGPFVRWRAMRQRAVAALRQVGHADIPPEAPVAALSIAQRQLVEIARAVAIGARVVVLDEPTSSLAEGDVGRLFALMRRLRADGHAVIYISHVLEEVLAIADRFTVMRDGRSVGSGDVAAASAGQLVRMMVDREVGALYPRAARVPGEVVLEATAVRGTRRPTSASLTLRRGEVVGIAGLVGAGRTEFVRALFGLDPVISGEVRLLRHGGAASPGQRWRQGAGMVSEDRAAEGLAGARSVADNLTLPALRGLGRGGFVLPARQEQAARGWAEQLSIACRSVRQPVATLSGGNQQKVALARLLHADVDVLLLDEPTRGIDVGSKAEIYGLIDRLAAGDAAVGRAPKAVLLVSSYLPELLGVCDRIAVMQRGRLGPARPVGALDGQRIMLEATGAGEGS